MKAGDIVVATDPKGHLGDTRWRLVKNWGDHWWVMHLPEEDFMTNAYYDEIELVRE